MLGNCCTYWGISMDIKKKIQDTLEQGVSVSKKYLDIAKEKAKDFSDMSVKKLEIHQLEEDIKRKKFSLGETVLALFMDEGRQSISAKTPELKELISQLETAVHSLAEKKTELKSDAPQESIDAEKQEDGAQEGQNE